MNTKTIFITSFHSLISRNILSTKLITMLSGKNIRTVVLVPKKKLDFFKNNYSASCPGAVFEGADFERTIPEKFLQYLSLTAVRSNSLALKRSTEMLGRGSWPAAIFGGSRAFQALVRFLSDIFTPKNTFSGLFKKYGPSLVFSTDVQSEPDIRLRMEAKALGIHTVAMVRSWDNLTTKGLLRVLPDRLLVQNDIAKQEAIRLHGIPEEAVEIIGIPHYDYYFSLLGNPVSKLENLWVLPQKKLALFIPTGDRYVKNNTVDRDILEMLDKNLDKNWQILIRLPFTDSVSFLDGQKSKGRFIFERPGSSFGVHKNAELSPKEDKRLAEELLRCDLVVTGPSTFALDAAYFDKPVILIAFDGKDERPYLKSLRRYYDYEHWGPVVKSGGVKLAKTQSTFKRAVTDYVADPQADRIQREKLAENFCFKKDGKAAERLAHLLLSMI